MTDADGGGGDTMTEVLPRAVTRARSTASRTSDTMPVPRGSARAAHFAPAVRATGERWLAGSVIEVAIRWGDSLLQVAHPMLEHGFWIGESLREKAPARAAIGGEKKSLRPLAGSGGSKRRKRVAGSGRVDFVLGAEQLGAQRLPLVLSDRGRPFFVIPPGAKGELELAGTRIRFTELEGQRLLRPLGGVPGARKHPLMRGATARIQVGDLTFSLRWVAAATRVGFENRSLVAVPGNRWTLASALVHAALLAALNWLPNEPAPSAHRVASAAAAQPPVAAWTSAASPTSQDVTVALPEPVAPAAVSGKPSRSEDERSAKPAAEDGKAVRAGAKSSEDRESHGPRARIEIAPNAPRS